MERKPLDLSKSFTEDYDQPKSCFRRCCRCCRKSVEDDDNQKRKILLNPRSHPDIEQQGEDTNYIRTTKYTLVTFLPQNLYEQFQKAANFYFLLVAIVVSIPGISNIEPYTSIAPLVFVLAVTAVKEAIEDYGRYKEDKQQNNRRVLVLHPTGWQETAWKDILVGDIVKVLENESFPVDMVLLSSSMDKGICSIVTANLDGEATMKPRVALPQTAQLVESEALLALDITTFVECGPPTLQLDHFEGIWCGSDMLQYPLTSEQMLLRGARLADTDWVIGISVYVGEQTKLFLNSNEPRHKRSKMEGVMNEQMYLIFAIQFVVCFTCAAVSAWWTIKNGSQTWYLRYPSQSVLRNFLDIGVVNFFGFYVLFAVMVPISLYVSIELVKVAQSLLINWDLAMYEESIDQPAKARTSNLNEELGQIEYIFSDKTGTLTDNTMMFVKCSIRGKAYGHQEEEKSPLLADFRSEKEEKEEKYQKVPPASSWWAFKDDRLKQELLAEVELTRGEDLYSEENNNDSPSTSVRSLGGGSSGGSGSSSSSSSSGSSGSSSSSSLPSSSSGSLARPPTPKTTGGVQPRKLSSNFSVKTGERKRTTKRSLSGTFLSNGFGEVREFFTCLVVCSTVNPHFNDNEKKLEFRGTSIDEVALVSAARKFEVEFHTRTTDPHQVILDAPWGKKQAYDILHIIDFTSQRARMSVICRTRSGKIMLYCKGADSALLPLLDPEHEDNKGEIIANTKQHLEEFSSEGLRTLMLTFRELDRTTYNAWHTRYEEASREIGNRKEKMEAVGAEIEKNLILLGVTAIEDKLQAGVAECIVKLREAGIKIWVLTGDKTGTAVNIGKSAGLIDKGLIVRYVQGSTPEEMEIAIRDALDAYPPIEHSSSSSRRTSQPLLGSTFATTSNHQHNYAQGMPQGTSTPRPSDGSVSASHPLFTPSTSLRVPKSSISHSSHPGVSISVGVASGGGGSGGSGLTPDPHQQRSGGEDEPSAVKSEDKEGAVLDRKVSEGRRTAWGGSLNVTNTGPGDIRGHTALVIDGTSLMHALHRRNRAQLLRLVHHPHSRVVICARMAPKQKAAIVQFIKESLPVRTLSIGDGANDVSMIQAAHVGVGIYGKEGRQAVNASDYAIAQFRFLARLLLVHGRLSYKRNSKLILYSFYKNFGLATTQLVFSIYSAMSANEIYDGYLLNTFNVFFTSLPILFVAVLYRELPLEDMLKYPRLYINGLQNSAFNYRVFWSWLILGAVHGVVAFFIAFLGMDSLGLSSCSIACYCYMVVIVNVKLVLGTSWNGWMHFIVWGSIIFWFIFGLAYNSIIILSYVPDAYYTFFVLFTVPQFYFGLLFVSAWAILPDFVWLSFYRNFSPRPKHIIQEIRQLKKDSTGDLSNHSRTHRDGDEHYKEMVNPTS